MTKFVTESEKQFYKDEGYVVLKGVYSSKEVEEIKREYEKIWCHSVASGSIYLNPAEPMDSLYRNLFQIHRQNEFIFNLMSDPRNFEIAESVLGEDALLAATTIFFKAPGTRGTETHRDGYGYGYGVLGGQACALWLSLDKSDETNGGIYIVPRTHKLGLLNISVHIGQSEPAPEGYKTVHIDTEPGDVIIWDSLTVHGSPPNRTKDRFRRSFFMYFLSSSVEKVLDSHDKLVNKNGELVKKPLNRKHKEMKKALDAAPYWGGIKNHVPHTFRSKYVTYLDNE